MTFEQLRCAGRRNNLDLIRLVAAMAVVVSHAWPLALGPGTAEPLKSMTGHSLGGWAVGLFFFLSGILITASAETHSPAAFWRRRALRILPGLFVALVAGLALAVLSGGRADPGSALAYVLRGLTLVSIEHNLPGAWAANPYRGAVNGPLWSLFHEVAAYVLAFAAVRMGILRPRGAPDAFLLLAVILWANASWMVAYLPRIDIFAPLWLAFALGMVAWRCRAVLPLRWELAAATWLFALAIGGWAFGMVALGYTALLVGWRLPARPLSLDLSYGIYIYGWPVAQLIVHLAGPISPLALAVASLVAVLPLAWLSWTLVEAPALRAVRTPRMQAAE